jgi:hypothetical protein
MIRFLPSRVRLTSMLLGVASLSGAACLSISEPNKGLSVFTILGGNNQVVVVNTIAPQPLTVRTIDEKTGVLPGVTVTWIITSGTGTLSATSTVTDDSGLASINFTAGSTTGPVLVRATAEDLRVTFTIDVVAQPPA